MLPAGMATGRIIKWALSSLDIGVGTLHCTSSIMLLRHMQASMYANKMCVQCLQVWRLGVPLRWQACHWILEWRLGRLWPRVLGKQLLPRYACHSECL